MMSVWWTEKKDSLPWPIEPVPELVFVPRPPVGEQWTLWERRLKKVAEIGREPESEQLLRLADLGIGETGIVEWTAFTGAEGAGIPGLLDSKVRLCHPSICQPSRPLTS